MVTDVALRIVGWKIQSAQKSFLSRRGPNWQFVENNDPVRAITILVENWPGFKASTEHWEVSPAYKYPVYEDGSIGPQMRLLD
ncbi:hypothetical protein KAZ57_00085 [Patescibacteria group bacterium]|nr:hypothetical protein [Patescibacteria group bacterium]